MLASLGFEAHGVDVSETGIAIAQKAFPNIKVSVGSAYDDLASRLGSFPLVVSLEVIAHCTNPRAFAKTFLDLIAPGGVGFLSTPYHGYLKNLALALSGRMDAHFSTLWPGGPVKFFSADTLCQLLATEGATQLQLLRVGRIPPLAKAMIAIVRKAEV
jgi:2-polyprenyl-6-hydroxyphenyl methylase/3-demethylubiquinone-9 3-methyltransferase